MAVESVECFTFTFGLRFPWKRIQFKFFVPSSFLQIFLQNPIPIYLKHPRRNSALQNRPAVMAFKGRF